ncbi:MAG TPA: hypothetical protein VFL62_18630 [Bradyrhizobium sp.]|uniref:hypothetical protein n=1 Tax=Bradyrhizobium sp. TaxID=376 RepID=UPI002D7EC984|nr:hypothetical protein [Bradyrhizobium sp.]HET7888243.1 hypothetical protein [Bradyrhizobium sp.]
MDRQQESRSLQDRLKAFTEEERKKVAQLPQGPERDLALQKIRQADAAAHLDAWTQSPELPAKRLPKESC